LTVHKPEKINKQTTHKDAQNHFGQLAEKGQNCGKKILSKNYTKLAIYNHQRNPNDKLP
jgi:hypothetical protein